MKHNDNSHSSAIHVSENIKEQLSSRPQFSWGHFYESASPEEQALFLLAPSDLGVMRNGGKRGSAHAPQAILNAFKKLAFHPHHKSQGWRKSELTHRFKAIESFEEEQRENQAHITNLLDQPSSVVVEIGGGHDHVYPLGAALLEKYGELLIINIDAHLDTRADQYTHSGTPFRQLDQLEGKLHLLQVGIHDYANVPANFEGMNDMKVLSMKDISSGAYLKEVEEFLKIKGDIPLLLSLDCDGLDGSFMSAVSAVNHQGLSKEHMDTIMDLCQKYWSKTQTPPLFGLYEYNPLFDDNHASCARYLSSLIHSIL